MKTTSDDQFPEIRDAVRALCAQFPDEYHRKIDEARGYPEEFVQALTQAGWMAALIPQEYGGSGLSMAEASVIMEEINRSGGNSGACHGQMYVMNAIVRSGSEAQKQQYLPQIASGELRIQSMGVTEPTTGSDTTQLKTTAVKKNGRWVINGQKVWSSGAQFSEWGLLIARSDRSAPKHKGMTAFMVPMDTPGVEVRPIRQMSGSSDFNEVFFTDVRVPESKMLLGEGRGFEIAQGFFRKICKRRFFRAAARYRVRRRPAARKVTD